MIVTMFPAPADRAKAIGVYGFVASAGGSIGLLAGGAVTQAISWHWIFFINIPVGLATAFLVRRLVEHRDGIGLGAGADIPGAVLLTSGLMLGVYTILEVDKQGWGSARTLGLGAISLALQAAFLLRQARIPQPPDAAAPVPLAQRRGRERGAGLPRRRDVQHVLPGGALHAAHPPLRRAPGRHGIPARDDRDGHDVAAVLRPPHDALRPEGRR